MTRLRWAGAALSAGLLAGVGIAESAARLARIFDNAFGQRPRIGSGVGRLQ